MEMLRMMLRCKCCGIIQEMQSFYTQNKHKSMVFVLKGRSGIAVCGKDWERSMHTFKLDNLDIQSTAQPSLCLAKVVESENYFVLVCRISFQQRSTLIFVSNTISLQFVIQMNSSVIVQKLKEYMILHRQRMVIVLTDTAPAQMTLLLTCRWLQRHHQSNHQQQTRPATEATNIMHGLSSKRYTRLYCYLSAFFRWIVQYCRGCVVVWKDVCSQEVNCINIWCCTGTFACCLHITYPQYSYACSSWKYL